MSTQTWTEPEVDDAGATDERFAAYYTAYRARLVRFAACRFGWRDAEDIADEAFTRAYATAWPEGGGRDPWPWLLCVVRTQGLDLVRARRHEAAVDELPDVAVLAGAEDDPEASALRRAEIGAVGEALSAMPTAMRQVLWLNAVEELSCPNIARSLGRSPDGVRQTLFRARQRLRQEFEAVTAGKLGACLPLAAFCALRHLFRSARRAGGQAPAAAATATGAMLTVVLTVGIIGLATPPASPATPLQLDRVVSTTPAPHQPAPAPSRPAVVTKTPARAVAPAPLSAPSSRAQPPAEPAARPRAVPAIEEKHHVPAPAAVPVPLAQPAPPAPAAQPAPSSQPIATVYVGNPLTPGTASHLRVEQELPVGTVTLENTTTVGAADGVICTLGPDLCH